MLGSILWVWWPHGGRAPVLLSGSSIPATNCNCRCKLGLWSSEEEPAQLVDVHHLVWIPCSRGARPPRWRVTSRHWAYPRRGGQICVYAVHCCKWSGRLLHLSFRRLICTASMHHTVCLSALWTLKYSFLITCNCVSCMFQQNSCVFVQQVVWCSLLDLSSKLKQVLEGTCT